MIQAMSTYTMGVYKIPAEVTDHIHAMMARFWWGQDEAKRKGIWVLGTLKVFNDALLGRQSWRHISNPDSLLNKVLSAKYYKGKSFLKTNLGVGGNFSWRSIWPSKGLLKEGIIWRIGNGSSVDIWDDPWVDNGTSRFIASPVSDEVSHVSDLIDHNARE
ncbi:uncharacterized protein LOC110709192 [Chenopodium quinoa]|uniref:uncharacterized protein LOC110709192 n=1 Tax=Chenopodium quinoa TaxID=63459 RepID=UPI000B79A427|nr:uncharacterized protein LOC110709192 [Chenopodium quinoa]